MMYRYRMVVKSIYRAEPTYIEVYATNDRQAHSVACRRVGGVYDFKILSMVPAKEVIA